MPGYQYLDNNIWQGLGGFAGGAGNDFSRAIVGLQALKYNQAMQQQQLMMQMQQMALERQKFEESKTEFGQQQGLAERQFTAGLPETQARTGYLQSQAEAQRANVGAMSREAAARDALGRALYEQGTAGAVDTALRGRLDSTQPLPIDALKSQINQAIIAQQQAQLLPGAGLTQNIAAAQLGMDPAMRERVALGYPPRSYFQQPTLDERMQLARLTSGLKAADLMLRPTVTKGPLGSTSVVDPNKYFQFLNTIKPFIETGIPPAPGTVPTVELPAGAAISADRGAKTIYTQAEYDALQEGEDYIYEGVTYTKGR